VQVEPRFEFNAAFKTCCRRNFGVKSTEAESTLAAWHAIKESRRQEREGKSTGQGSCSCPSVAEERESPWATTWQSHSPPQSPNEFEKASRPAVPVNARTVNAADRRISNKEFDSNQIPAVGSVSEPLSHQSKARPRPGGGSAVQEVIQVVQAVMQERRRNATSSRPGLSRPQGSGTEILSRVESANSSQTAKGTTAASAGARSAIPTFLRLPNESDVAEEDPWNLPLVQSKGLHYI
jgi:hypothetical protein